MRNRNRPKEPRALPPDIPILSQPQITALMFAPKPSYSMIERYMRAAVRGTGHRAPILKSSCRRFRLLLLIAAIAQDRAHGPGIVPG